MKEGEIPNVSIKEASLFKNLDNLVIEIFVLEHPKYFLRLEDITVENILISQECNDFIFLT
jgi:hypothetical protein